MSTQRAYVSDKGLTRHLGKRIGITKKGKDAKTRKLGNLAFFPDRFVCLVYKGKNMPDLIPLEEGDSIGLRHATPRTFGKDSYLHEYIYLPQGHMYKE